MFCPNSAGSVSEVSISMSCVQILPTFCWVYCMFLRFSISFLQAELKGILKDYVGRESPLYFAERLTERYKRADGTGPNIYLKREDLNHTGAHKINNAVGQALLAKRIGKNVADCLFILSAV